MALVGSTYRPKVKVTADQYKVSLIEMHFCPDASGPFQDDSAPIPRTKGLKDLKDIKMNNNNLWFCKHIWENLE